MAIGDVINISPDSYSIVLMASAIATNGPPSGAVGLDANLVRSLVSTLDHVSVALVSTAGSGVMTVTARLWSRLGATTGWVVHQSLNAGSAIGETSPDSINWWETVTNFGAADRYYLELTAIGGTSTAVTGYLLASR